MKFQPPMQNMQLRTADAKDRILLCHAAAPVVIISAHRLLGFEEFCLFVCYSPVVQWCY